MTATAIIELLTDLHPGAITASFADAKHARVHTTAEHWPAMARTLREHAALQFDWLACLTGLDYVATGQLAVCYDLWSTAHGHQFAVKVYMPRVGAAVATVSDLWPAANWQEREAYDLFGIQFIGHPDLTRILLADDWVGHPLLKDYVFPREYHGIPGSVELDWQQSK